MKKLFRHRTLSVVVVLAVFLASGCSAFDFGMPATSSMAPLGEAVSDESAVGLASSSPAAGTEERFAFLSQQRSSTCSLQPETVATYPDEQRIQGSCCSPMDLHRYQEQVEGLKQFPDIAQIPEDPYDISAGLAKELFGYQQTITLTAEQQAIYDEAMEMSDEGGPCCCQCWRWYAFAGQAKYLIKEHGWTAEQIAELWDTEDGCGGAGHTHGEGHR